MQSVDQKKVVDYWSVIQLFISLFTMIQIVVLLSTCWQTFKQAFEGRHDILVEKIDIETTGLLQKLQAKGVLIGSQQRLLQVHLTAITSCLKQQSLANAKISATAVRVWRSLAKKSIRQINAKNIMLTSTFSGLQRWRWRYGSIFIRLAAVYENLMIMEIISQQ